MRLALPVALAAVAVLSFASVATAAPPGSNDPAKAVPAQVLVGFPAGVSEGARQRVAAGVSATARDVVAPGSDRYARVELLRLPLAASNAWAIDRLLADAEIAFAEPNWIYTTAATSSDPYYTNGSLWGLYGDGTSPANQYGSQAGEAWAAGSTGASGVYVGVIDEGIQYTHPDLDGQVWTNPFDRADGVDNDANGYVDDVHGWDFTANDSTVYDGGTKGNLDDHGTHVAGTIGAESNGSGVVGVNWNVTLISAKFLGRNGGTTENAIRAVDYITGLKTRHGLNIVATNNSWGGGGFSQGLLDAINRGGDAGILFIAAAGNGGRDGVGDNNDVTPHYPSNYQCTANGKSYDCVISVAAIRSDGTRASFSNYGAKSVDLGAPGASVWSTTAYNTYSSYSGTSMATPHVTGGAALYAAAHPGATAATIKNGILGATVATSSLSGRTVTGGRLDVSSFR